MNNSANTTQIVTQIASCVFLLAFVVAALLFLRRLISGRGSLGSALLQNRDMANRH
jgi:flagellar biogenesis protein FliO